MITQYSLEGRYFSQSVWDRWHIVNDPQMHSIWPNHSINAYHKTKPLKDILAKPNQRLYILLVTNFISNSKQHLCDQYATLSKPTSPLNRDPSSHNSYQQPLFPFLAIHPTFLLCNQKQQQSNRVHKYCC